MSKTMSRPKLAVLLSLLVLGACGGSGEGTPAAPAAPAAKAEGVYGGTITGGSSPAFQLLILENDEYWAMYGVSAGNTFLVEGFVQGTGASNNGNFTSGDARDFGFAPATAGTVNATYDAGAHTISGTLGSATAGTASFSGGAIAGSLYNYDAGPALATVTGNWVLMDLAGASLSVAIAPSGSFTASSAGCSMSGTLTPRASGKNVFNLSLTFGGAPCLLPGQTATGIALAYPLANGSMQLLVAAHALSRTQGMAAFGTR